MALSSLAMRCKARRSQAGEHGGSRRPWGWATVMQICRLIIVGLLASVVSLASVGGLLSKVCFTSYFTSKTKLQPKTYGLYLARKLHRLLERRDLYRVNTEPPLCALRWEGFAFASPAKLHSLGPGVGVVGSGRLELKRAFKPEVGATDLQAHAKRPGQQPRAEAEHNTPARQMRQ